MKLNSELFASAVFPADETVQKIREYNFEKRVISKSISHWEVNG